MRLRFDWYITIFYDIFVVITRHLQVAGAVFLSIFFFKKADARIRSIRKWNKEGDLWGVSQGVTKTSFKPCKYKTHVLAKQVNF